MFEIGDWVTVTRGVNIGQQGEVIDDYDPLDGGTPIYTLNLLAGGQLDVPGDRLQKTHRRDRR
jgi:hypothetical protein